MNKVSLDEVMSDDPNSPFWQSIMNNPNYAKFEQDIAYIVNQSHKHGKPFRDIDTDDLDPYD
jgi:hypothetical protein